MKFKAEPNLFVRISNKYVQRVTGKKGFYFDNNGEFETENEVLIKALSPNFEMVEEIKEEIEEEKVLKCKKCDFETDNQGLLLHHYKYFHKKED